jgi:hypothetical protein
VKRGVLCSDRLAIAFARRCCRRTESRGIWLIGALAPEGLRVRHGSMGRLIGARLFRVCQIPAPTGLP